MILMKLFSRKAVRILQAFAVCVALLTLQSCDKTAESPLQQDVPANVVGAFTVVTEITGEEAEVIIQDRMRMEQEVDPDYVFAAEISVLSPSHIEVRVRIPGVKVEVNGESATVAEDGSFAFSDLRLKAGDFVTLTDSDAFVYFQRSITDEEAASGRLNLEHHINWDQYLMKIAEKGCHEAASSDSEAMSLAVTYYPCLDNNGTSWGGFLYSDCYMSLFYGPANYSWMCWYEAMNVYHDHKGNIWCDGSHNCSLFVHNWNWNCQKWHTHSGSWKVGSGC